MENENTDVPLAIDDAEIPPPAEPPTLEEELEFLAKRLASPQEKPDLGGDD